MCPGRAATWRPRGDLLSTRPVFRGVFASLLCVALTACSEGLCRAAEPGHAVNPAMAEGDGAVGAVAGDGSVVSRYAGHEWMFGTVPPKARAADDHRDPIKVGLINTDSGPVAPMPELHQATIAAIEFINAELGGVDGRPIQLVACATELSPESAERCAQQMIDEDVVAVLGGMVVIPGRSIDLLAQNDLAWVGGIPIDPTVTNSPNSFQFSGGMAGAFVAFAHDAAVNHKVERAAVIFADYGPISDAARTFGIDVLKQHGVEEVAEVSFPMMSTDLLTVAQKAMDSKPQALLVGAADSGCPAIMDALHALNVQVPVYMVGSCADAKAIKKVGLDAAAGTIFAVETRVDQSDNPSVDTEVYAAAVEKYGPAGLNAAGAGTVEFRSMMNLYDALVELGPEATSAQVVEFFQNAVGRPSFDGHDYTCDGKQIAGLQSMCAPQEVLIQIHEDGAFTEVSDGWVDVPSILAGG